MVESLAACVYTQPDGSKQARGGGGADGTNTLLSGGFNLEDCVGWSHCCLQPPPVEPFSNVPWNLNLICLGQLCDNTIEMKIAVPWGERLVDVCVPAVLMIHCVY